MGSQHVKDGGPAFPTISTDKMWTSDGDHVLPDVSSSGGLTIRDWFAGKALQGMLADSENSYSCTAEETHWTQAVARVAYQMADAMIQARKG
jgi:hypothetical protein